MATLNSEQQEAKYGTTRSRLMEQEMLRRTSQPQPPATKPENQPTPAPAPDIASLAKWLTNRSDPKIPEAAALKNAERVLVAAQTGVFNDILRPDNKHSRALFQEITGQKLPPGLKSTQDLFTGKPFPVRPLGPLSGRGAVLPDAKAPAPAPPAPSAEQVAATAWRNVFKAASTGELAVKFKEKTGDNTYKETNEMLQGKEALKALRDQKRVLDGLTALMDCLKNAA